ESAAVTVAIAPAGAITAPGRTRRVDDEVGRAVAIVIIAVTVVVIRGTGRGRATGQQQHAKQEGSCMGHDTNSVTRPEWAMQETCTHRSCLSSPDRACGGVRSRSVRHPASRRAALFASRLVWPAPARAVYCSGPS